MCGISGVVNIKKGDGPLYKDVLNDAEKAVKVQYHRGPDDSGICGFSFSDQHIDNEETVRSLLMHHRKYDGVFGFNRLSIKDVSTEGHQPMMDSTGKVVLIFNGEIYNDEELRKELVEQKKVVFHGASDTEVLLQMYLNYGIDATLSRLNGMFAFVIADLRNGKIFVARDRIGIKPLYYYADSKVFVFASEIKAIVQFSCVRKELDIDAYNSRLIFSRPSSQVLLKNVELVEPGELIVLDIEHGISKVKYYDINDYYRDAENYKNLNEVLEVMDEILCNAVRRQMISDVKLGCQLSGGIDSSLVAYYAHKVSQGDFHDAVSIVTEQGGGEECYIDRVRDNLNLNVHKFIMNDDFFIENYESMIWHNDAPVYKPFFAAFKRLAMGARDYVTVLLSGEGADEIAGGYTRFATGVFQPFISQTNSSNGSLVSYKDYAEYAVMTDSTITDFTTLGYHQLGRLIDEQMEIFNSFSGSNLTKHLKYEISQRLPESLLRQDKMTMAHSIENRVPLLDNDVIDFVMRLPEQYLLRFSDIAPTNLSENPMTWMQGKFIFKELLSSKFGKEFVYRRKQTMNESISERDMLATKAFRDYFYSVILPGMKVRGLVDYRVVLACYEDIQNISMRSFNSMWRAMGLETWCQQFLDGMGGVPLFMTKK